MRKGIDKCEKSIIHEQVTEVALVVARVAELERELAAERARAAELAAEREALAAENERLRAAYRQAQLELELVRRRLFVAKAERVDTGQLELEFMAKLAELDRIGAEVARAQGLPCAPGLEAATSSGGASATRRPTGRRDLSESELPVERIEVIDPDLEGKAERIGFEESWKLRWRRGGLVRVMIARVKYRMEPEAPAPGQGAADEPPSVDGGEAAGPTVVTAPMPPQALARCLAAPSLLAHIISDKFTDGLPLHRQEDRYSRLGVRLDRGTMCRWVEDAGCTLGATVVEAMRKEALATAFCLATDATGVLVQPPRGKQVRGPCRRGHFFVQIADRDHVFFEYTPRETSAAVGEMFRGFSGYVLADAKSVYDLLFRSPEARPPPEDGSEPDRAVRKEVGCWSHLRRKFWEAAIAKDAVAREGLARVMRMFQLERSWKNRPAEEKKALRAAHLRPHVDAFFLWAATEYERVQGQRGLLRSALGYAVRQREALVRFFEDGRLPMTNNESERQIRRVAVGRKAWLFVGSDDHAQAAGNLLTLIASARLHGLDPEEYLRDVLRVLPHWPRDRYLELAPKYWAATRARLDAAQLAVELGPLDIPPPEAPAEEPRAS